MDRLHPAATRLQPEDAWRPSTLILNDRQGDTASQHRLLWHDKLKRMFRVWNRFGLRLNENESYHVVREVAVLSQRRQTPVFVECTD
jgi:hypothetical protein